MMRPVRSAACMAALLCAAGAAWGHGVPAGTATVRLNGDRLFAVFSVPVSLLGLADEDGDGQLTLAEFERHRADITDAVRMRVRVESGFEQGEVTFEDLLLPHAEEGEAAPASTHVGVMRSTRFSGPVHSARLVLRLFEGDQQEAKVEAALLDERGGLLERATLSRAVPSFRLGARAVEVAWLHAGASAAWVVHSPWAWGLLLLALLAGALMGARPRRAVVFSSGAGGVLLLSRAVVVQGAWGRELPHEAAAGFSTTAVLTACTVAALWVGLQSRKLRRGAAGVAPPA